MTTNPQQIINTGAVANDGTGESLRDAFNAVNNNFANVWAAGPVDSQVVITNNVISTNVTNLDLLLGGNGTGNVGVLSNLQPTIDGVRLLGQPNKRWDEVHSVYYYGNGAFLTGISGGSGGGNLTFANTAPANATPGDMWIEADTGVQYVYFNDDTTSQWAEMEAYLSFSSGENGNVNFTSVDSNIIPSTGNTYNIGSTVRYWNDGFFGGNVYANAYFYANGIPIGQGGGNLGNSTVTAKQNILSTSVLNQTLVLAGNGIAPITANSTIIPSIDGVYDLGNAEHRWDTVNALYFVGNGSQLTGINGTATLSGNLQGNLQGNGYGANAFSFVSATGNITGGNLKATGNIYIGNTVFTRTLTVGRAVTPVTVPLASNNSFNILTVGSGNVVVYTT